MTILLGLNITPTVLVICDKENKWVGFTRIQLSKPKDCTYLINDRRSFILIIKKNKNASEIKKNAYEWSTKVEAIARRTSATSPKSNCI